MTGYMAKPMYMEGGKITDLGYIDRFESGVVQYREHSSLWLNLPAGHDFPLYTTLVASDKLYDCIADNSIYGVGEPLDKHHYIAVIFRDDDTALITLQYQSIIGSRWLMVVPQQDVIDFVKEAQERLA